MTGGAQAIVNLLDHFDFAKKITSVLIQVEHNSGQKYFIYTLYAEKHITKQHASEKEGTFANVPSFSLACCFVICFSAYRV